MRWFASRPRLGRNWRGRPGRIRRGRSRPGRILAVKWGLNPNSSSLGVDVTFLLFGAAALSMVTPVIGALLRWRKPATDVPGEGQATK
jgi:hypothetical protein